MIKKIAVGILVIAAIALICIAAKNGLNRQEVFECKTWEQQADAYPAFFLKQWQADQCAAHDININAPIK